MRSRCCIRRAAWLEGRWRDARRYRARCALPARADAVEARSRAKPTCWYCPTSMPPTSPTTCSRRRPAGGHCHRSSAPRRGAAGAHPHAVRNGAPHHQHGRTGGRRRQRGALINSVSSALPGEEVLLPTCQSRRACRKLKSRTDCPNMWQPLEVSAPKSVTSTDYSLRDSRGFVGSAGNFARPLLRWGASVGCRKSAVVRRGASPRSDSVFADRAARRIAVRGASRRSTDSQRRIHLHFRRTESSSPIGRDILPPERRAGFYHEYTVPGHAGREKSRRGGGSSAAAIRRRRPRPVISPAITTPASDGLRL